jgi:hypothetical protein
MIRRGTRVTLTDRWGARVTGKVLGSVNWDRTYYKVLLDDGRTVTSEKVERA